MARFRVSARRRMDGARVLVPIAPRRLLRHNRASCAWILAETLLHNSTRHCSVAVLSVADCISGAVALMLAIGLSICEARGRKTTGLAYDSPGPGSEPHQLSFGGCAAPQCERWPGRCRCGHDGPEKRSSPLTAEVARERHLRLSPSALASVGLCSFFTHVQQRFMSASSCHCSRSAECLRARRCHATRFTEHRAAPAAAKGVAPPLSVAKCSTRAHTWPRLVRPPAPRVEASWAMSPAARPPLEAP